MRKAEELLVTNSCFNKAGSLEMLFVLLARDPAAPATVEFWIQERIRLGLNKEGDEKIESARKCIEAMRDETHIPN